MASQKEEKPNSSKWTEEARWIEGQGLQMILKNVYCWLVVKTNKQIANHKSKNLRIIEDLVKSFKNPKAHSVPFFYTLFANLLWEDTSSCSFPKFPSPPLFLVAGLWEPPHRAVDRWRDITVLVTCSGTSMCMGCWGRWGNKGKPPSIPTTDMHEQDLCSWKQQGYQSGALMTKSSRIPTGELIQQRSFSVSQQIKDPVLLPLGRGFSLGLGTSTCCGHFQKEKK